MQVGRSGFHRRTGLVSDSNGSCMTETRIADSRAGTRAIFIPSQNGNAIGHFAHPVSSTREPLYSWNEEKERERERERESEREEW